MMEELTVLLENLSSKLGTTTEYLWGVLLAQAKISAILSLAYVLFVIVFGVVLLKVHIWLTKPNKEGDYYKRYNQYDDDSVLVPMIIATFLFVVMFAFAIISVGDIVNGLLNPEYWALNEIFESLK